MGRHTQSELPPPVNRKLEKANAEPQSSGRPPGEKGSGLPDAPAQGWRQEEKDVLIQDEPVKWLDPTDYRKLEREMLDRYKLNPNKLCPNCGRPFNRGLSGHLSKCLRTSKSKTASTTTT